MPMIDDILRILAVILWVVVTVILYRSDGPRTRWSLISWYVFGTAVTVTVWRAIVALRNLAPTYIPTDLFRFFLRSVQPTVYIAMGFALVLAVRAHPYDR